MRIRKGVIPVAGHGVRLFPATKAVKKELFPLVDRTGSIKPIVQMIIEEALASGIEQVCIVVQPGGDELIRRYFCDPLPPDFDSRIGQSPDAHAEYQRLRQLGEHINYVFQQTQEGYGHAVYCARQWVGEEPFLLLLGDHVYLSATGDRCARQLIDAFEVTRMSTSGVVRTPESMLQYFGTIAGKPDARLPGLYAVTDIVEKPTVEYARAHLRVEGITEGSYLSWFGLHAFTPEIFECIEYHIRNNLREKGEIQLTTAQELLRRRRNSYYAYEVKGVRCDIGIPSEYARTMALMAGLSEP